MTNRGQHADADVCNESNKKGSCTNAVISLHVRPASLMHHFIPGRMFLGNVRPYRGMVLRTDTCFLLMCVPCQSSLDSYIAHFCLLNNKRKVHRL